MIRSHSTFEAVWERLSEENLLYLLGCLGIICVSGSSAFLRMQMSSSGLSEQEWAEQVAQAQPYWAWISIIVAVVGFALMLGAVVQLYRTQVAGR